VRPRARLVVPPLRLTRRSCSQQSTFTNKSRLKLLHRREEHVQDLFTSARDKLIELSTVRHPLPHPLAPTEKHVQDEGRYSQFLTSIILQGVLSLLEPSVTVISRAKDKALVERASEDASSQYTEISGRQVKISVDASLSDDLSGGVKLVSGTGRITLDNTLDERLRLLEDSVRHLFSCNV
jgi:V-type H+-transporting ATPase subunit E